MKVLVADDEPVSRRLLESSLGRWGYQPIIANDGLEALEILSQPDSPKLAVLDWLMPGKSGLEVCRAIRQTKPEPYTYMLLLTAKTSKTDVIHGLDAGADDYVTKPFEMPELVARIRAVLRRGTAAPDQRTVALGDIETALRGCSVLIGTVRSPWRR